MEDAEEGAASQQQRVSLPSLSLLLSWYQETHPSPGDHRPPVVIIIEDYEGFPPHTLQDLFMCIRYIIKLHFPLLTDTCIYLCILCKNSLLFVSNWLRDCKPGQVLCEAPCIRLILSTNNIIHKTLSLYYYQVI